MGSGAGLASVMKQLNICSPVLSGQRLAPNKSSLSKNPKTGMDLNVQLVSCEIRSSLLPFLEIRRRPADKADTEESREAAQVTRLLDELMLRAG